MKLLICSVGYKLGNGADNNVVIINNFNNEKRVVAKDEKINNLDIIIKGTNNKVYIDGRNDFYDSRIFIEGRNNIVNIKRSNYTHRININLPQFNNLESNDRRVEIGENCYIGSAYLMCALNNEKIIIGNRCFLGTNVHIRTSDAHTIYSLVDEHILNARENNVEIADHCWIGEDAFISKGSYLNNDTIVGAKAFVCKKFFEKNIVIAGIPARIIRTNVNWDSMNTAAFSLKHGGQNDKKV